ncbi:TPA: hypothetical protein DD394_05870 [bacterium UBP9_UBA11836]|nr:hypothetical protein [bacterium UBP9_UBA11836]
MKITEDWEELTERTTVAGAARHLCQKLAAKFGLKGNDSLGQTQAWPNNNGAENQSAANNSDDNSFLASVDESGTINKIIIH